MLRERETLAQTAMRIAPVAAAMGEYARALAADPWLERWPMVLADVIPARAGQR